MPSTQDEDGRNEVKQRSAPPLTFMAGGDLGLDLRSEITRIIVRAMQFKVFGHRATQAEVDAAPKGFAEVGNFVTSPGELDLLQRSAEEAAGKAVDLIDQASRLGAERPNGRDLMRQVARELGYPEDSTSTEVFRGALALAKRVAKETAVRATTADPIAPSLSTETIHHIATTLHDLSRVSMGSFSEAAEVVRGMGGKEDDAWQPIETAPKDGTPIIIAQRGKTGTWYIDTAENSYWNCYGRSTDPKDLWTARESGNIVVCSEPTHWRPLPPPPRQNPEAASTQDGKDEGGRS